MDTGEEFGPWLARQLKLAGKTQAELAQELKLTRAAISAWITGRSTPRPTVMVEIAKALGTDIGTVHTRTTDTQAGLPVTWYHRPGYPDGGRELGNAAAFAFDADVQVLARETCQNSLDERLTENGRPVRVRYTLHELTGETLDAFREAILWNDLFPHYSAVSEGAGNQKVGRVVDAGVRDMYEKGRLVLLRVDDYNASGLTGDDYEDGKFAAVVRRQLESLKSGHSAGGSYGLGKATLWATSALGLVLINSTLSEPHEGRTERRVIGRLELPWRKVEGESYAGPAWFGRPDPDSPGARVARSWWADQETVARLHLARESDEPGTSFLIVGAHDVASLEENRVDDEAGDEESAEDTRDIRRMHRRLVEALGRDFWAAMTAGGNRLPLLEVSVRALRNGEVIVPEQQVDPSAEQPARTRALRAHYEGTTVDRLVEAGQVAARNVPLKLPLSGGARGTLGIHQAVLLVTESVNDAESEGGAKNQVHSLRGNRMTVKTAGVPNLPLGTNLFQAVLLVGEAAGEAAPFAKEAEEFLRAAEPPEHDRWGQTEELTLRWSPSAYRRITALTTEVNSAVREIVARPKRGNREGGEALRKALTVKPKPKAKAPSGPVVPVLDGLEATVGDDGEWRIIAEVSIPRGDEIVPMAPIAQLDVRSGGRPKLDWAELEAVEGCEVEDGILRFAPGTRRAKFRGSTDVTSHPVRTALTRLVLELRAGKGV
ncbi:MULTISPECIES: helix-turn-helix domain-containing protein [Streptomyces]|uniref:Helix-turn-helix transcriptional regulator n=1 Tax=Streptomyces caniscabiei TaxID=2746961 RepID=A0ABU4MQF0_9ACTN|nr:MULTISPECIES: helix-turn-helix transcriptional regulator [Streptomyces]MBE4740104.1 helix-turn-helix transcriptional regulator [Streptomyces caniscabiei]MBE4758994.1 helix-turn-helix transcriptional regulator [Streptomyces caniscabiei]MBE4772863.1 helix-turn-helix transcriptional regulator [Streptomyces caniscabiei]MBE4788248.1 helix-turn-helix transcriptional regulator [Streptomyces caniscabiei]MBE4797487.1 helix-turn-helix transcriptional regulator [Streptomyces caniscabiei]